MLKLETSRIWDFHGQKNGPNKRNNRSVVVNNLLM